ncbi:uncharacterized protein TEOVI_000821800 [Trypanosoma equiperdum]|uniref:START domain-containing protein n=2 Tax=Trypanozoon TaxID=39700 RepID=Q57TT5_TRYB2|nr:hypothetical protein, conserved [Trypanosoma brucei brucei TREU927]AAX80039.1 hypothetical protein, conserved [Trypanosoma brucei]AAZ13442.1 hypothetical protein, conserved [Trypanosoma brucei brucei TREU927]SCU67739.1 hypothetical protein, conserved [Trypanosoma equiperdum]
MLRGRAMPVAQLAPVVHTHPQPTVGADPATIAGRASQNNASRSKDVDVYCAAVDFTDVAQLLMQDPVSSGFRPIAHDSDSNTSLYSRPTEESPMDMIFVRTHLPCPPSALPLYMHASKRCQWDDCASKLRFVRTLPRPATAPVSTLTDVADANLLQLQPGQRRVGLYYMVIRSPVPFVRSRDLEMAVAEEVQPDGTVWLKGLSTPPDRVDLCNERRAKYIRARLIFFAMLAKPTKVTGGCEGCQMSCVSLVHPMGHLPRLVRRLVLAAQMRMAKRLRDFIIRHPPASLTDCTAQLHSEGKVSSTSTGSGGKSGMVGKTNGKGEPSPHSYVTGVDASECSNLGEWGEDDSDGGAARFVVGSKSSQMCRMCRECCGRLIALGRRVAERLPLLSSNL